MQSSRLVLPFGTLPPLRGDARDGTEHHLAAGAGPSSESHHNVIASSSSTSMALVKHDREVARVTSQAYGELARLSHAAAIASSSPSSSSSRSTRRPSQARATHNPSTSSMFIKAKPRKPLTKKTDLEAALDRNRNLLKSREVCRLLGASQLDKLKSDTAQLERTLQAKNEEGLDQVMVGLKVEDGDVKTAPDRSKPPNRYTTRGKAKLISAQENERLQRANFEAEQEMQRTREYEMMGRQLGKMDIAGRYSSDKRSKAIKNEPDGDIYELGLGPDQHDIDETEMGLHDGDDW